MLQASLSTGGFLTAKPALHELGANQLIDSHFLPRFMRKLSAELRAFSYLWKQFILGLDFPS